MPRWEVEYSRNRQLAIANGDETYQGHPCKHGHSGIRMLRYHGKCFDCHKGQNPYYTHNRQQVLDRQKAKRRSDPATYLVRAAKARAKKTGREFDLRVEDLKIPARCPVSGRPMVPCSPDAPSIDRVDNSRGYTRDNIMIISKRINAIKSSLTVEEARVLLDYMRSHELLK